MSGGPKPAAELVPVFMRIGHGQEHQIGWIELALDDNLNLDRAAVADVLRQAADEIATNRP